MRGVTSQALRARNHNLCSKKWEGMGKGRGVREHLDIPAEGQQGCLSLQQIQWPPACSSFPAG